MGVLFARDGSYIEFECHLWMCSNRLARGGVSKLGPRRSLRAPARPHRCNGHAVGDADVEGSGARPCPRDVGAECRRHAYVPADGAVDPVRRQHRRATWQASPRGTSLWTLMDTYRYLYRSSLILMDTCIDLYRYVEILT